ncbi:TraR/DksA C4-type zinc finger protein [Pseudomonas fuscovaginae UPB0736]|uniref:Transcriptional regulator, TraR/DksA family n=3 Tax=Pseudomonas TaxID=286 RepID=A0A0N0VKD8_9PSED|nr:MULTISPECIES: TraR/DksA C4-type zinc finger protein [Pseudomonas]KPA91853.1 transcriptional regulator, TraR/DksA family [Pseudomonas fuscovaginae]KPA99339.1 transcriptional regulator, TraR/DksA family [Pseudomonas fuscovaginae]QXI25730.1 TraR/DksA C4-type zinc finger protein [Pseudomonas vanderleydeniana]UUQ64992.1 TraR/DksA C4-type zinc finger protein [Pseudomonas fuscovaginae UPB0736]UZE31774.1 TraR/DksA C4-type zinc finger protein [Pseudomonas asplenii]
MTKEKLLAMPADDYMNAEQLAFFTELLQAMKVETHERIEQNRVAIESLDTPADPADAASVEEERTWLVNAIDRDQRMLPQLEQALDRIRDDSFGWCDDSGDPIGLKRLLISPTTKYCIEAQERHEQIDKHQRQA